MKFQFIGAALGAGAQDQRTEWGPAALKERGLMKHLDEAGFSLGDFPILQGTGQATLMQAMPMISQFNANLARMVRSSLEKGDFPVVLGGDHSIAAGTWSGAASAFPGEDLGLLWIDAHMDAHTPETTETGAVHGMPLAALLGHGDARLTNLEFARPKFKPENVCVLGVRSFEKGEADFLKRKGVRVYHMDEIRKRGFACCFYEAYRRVVSRAPKFGITFDLDSLDPAEMPSVGCAVGGGLFLDEIRPSLREAARDPRLVGLEVVEYNPFLDEANTSFLKVTLLLEELLWARTLSNRILDSLPPIETALSKSPLYIQ